MEKAYPGREIIAIGASAGGIEALVRLVELLPQDFPAALFVVVHFPSEGTSVLPRILSRAGALKAVHPLDHAPILPGRIYVARPNRHLLVGSGYVRVVYGPTENGHRPAVDPLMRTAARAYGPRVVGVVLSGGGDDGTNGLCEIKRWGGVAIVQKPDEALAPSMPRSALQFAEVDHCLSVAEIARQLERLAREPVRVMEFDAEREGEPMEQLMPAGRNPVDEEMALLDGELIEAPGFTCPACGGHLWETSEQGMLGWRCRVGHRYSPESLLEEKSSALEGALWAAVNALEENAALLRRMSERASKREQSLVAERFGARAENSHEQAQILREVLTSYAADRNGEEEERPGEAALHHARS